MDPVDSDTSVFRDTQQQTTSTIAPGEIVIGTIIALDPQGQPLVDFPENPHKSPLVAISTLPITLPLVGRQAALLFANGNPENPVVMGIIHSPLHELIATYDVTPDQQTDNSRVNVENTSQHTAHVDGKRVVIEAKEEIVLQCGDASITLTKAGKVIIRGKYLLSRSSGVNRILGGSVQVN